MASADSHTDWQSTKNTVLERNCHMLNNPDMSDISFTCEGSQKKFYAHKYVLGSSSAVFHAMFYGELAEKNFTVHLSDVNEESFEEFLRFLYTDECALTADNVISVMYLAKKYIVPSLTRRCVEFLAKNLSLDNVLDVLEQARGFDEKELEAQCWKIVASSTRVVVTADSFKKISQSTLACLLKRDNLSIPEVDLFQAVLKWADFQCSLKSLEPTGENRRSMIGDAIYAFRFLAMSQTEVAKLVSRSGLLTAEELLPIFEKLAGIDSPALKWTQPSRKPERIVRFSRFSEIELASFLASINFRNESYSLGISVNKDVLLLGVRLFGNIHQSKCGVTLEVKGTRVSGTYTPELDKDGFPGFDVMLDTPIMLKQEEVVILTAKIEGHGSAFGKNGTTSVTNQGGTVRFSNAPNNKNGTNIYETNTSSGQFHEIILSF